ncbi:hypothetical protein SAMN05216315_10284 [Nitrosospira sp. Nsp18]|uniref:hypothetical protein n=1 Tax=Nitrosospira sp. Nsp18 TaxID=1855334 RepID=UPI00088535CF|nr:hypothetical protein [Nitrosospira sp. Nsp18]SDA10897.1 hypothetical protein SAMN05216315_10284 [Nitrosospira sp. Nsp18]
MTKAQEMQSIIKRYREETGKDSVDMHDVAKYAIGMGWPLPKPKTAIDRLAEQFSSAAREEIRKDEVTGKPYRANLAVTTWQGTEQMTLWTDIDVAPRYIAHRSFQQRREQTVGDVLQLTFDVMHWNRVNETEDPINMPTDFTDDVQWRMNEPDKKQSSA